jgi:hypothetical protein
MNFKNVLQVNNASKWKPSKSTSKIEWYGPKGDMMVFFNKSNIVKPSTLEQMINQLKLLSMHMLKEKN